MLCYIPSRARSTPGMHSRLPHEAGGKTTGVIHLIPASLIAGNLLTMWSVISRLPMSASFEVVVHVELSVVGALRARYHDLELEMLRRPSDSATAHA